jgi:VWFA-related protein
MNVLSRAGTFLLCVSSFALQVSAQQPTGPASLPAAKTPLTLDVVVTDHAGKAVKGLTEKDFTVLTNGHPQDILSFQASGGGVATTNVQSAGPPVRTILLVDEVNTNFSRVAYEREQIKIFLLQNGGVLDRPVSMAFFSDKGTEIQNNPSRDGNALLASFDQHETGLRSISRSQGFYGAVEKFQLSLTTLQSLTAKEAQLPGRKIVIWISPGWPLLSGPRVELGAKDEARLFASIVAVSNALREARMTVYSVNPEGAEAAGGAQNFYYKEFLKPVTSAKTVVPANLALQVLAVQTGGLALTASNDIAGQIRQCVADADTFYTLTVDPTAADRPNEFHAIEVKVATPGLTARTRNGYYAQP